MSKGSGRRPGDGYGDGWDAIFGGVRQREVLLKKATGWDNGLNQDYSKGLGTWLADKPGARQQVVELFDKKKVKK